MNMDVPKINLLQSAERLLQERKSNHFDGKDTVVSEPANDQANFSSILSSKYLSIQNRLKDEQNELTKTQTKVGILNEPGIEKDGLINILFGKTPLFEELREMAHFDKNTYLKELNQKKDSQIQNIKKLEVEFENIMSAANVADTLKFGNTIKELNENLIKPIPEGMIERLIKD